MNILNKLFGKEKANKEEVNSVENNSVNSENSKAEAESKATEASKAEAENAAKTAAEQQPAAQPQEENKGDFVPFTLLINQVIPLQSGEVEVKGKLRGQCSVGEKVFVCAAPNFFLELELAHVETASGVTVHQAADQPVCLTLKGFQENQQIAPLMCVTNIPPMKEVNANTPVENPLLKAMISELHERFQDPNFMNILSFLACHTFYIARLDAFDADGNEIPDEEIQNNQGFTEGQKISFRVLKMGETPMFPLFTDWRSLMIGEQDKTKKPKAMIITFQDALSMVLKQEGAGIVINPFDQYNFNMDPNFLKNLVNSEGYQREFGQKAENANATATPNEAEKTE